MPENHSSRDKLRIILVPIATIGTIAFNYLAAIGRINNVTPDQISAAYPTLLTPAGYTFTIWSLIYLGLIAFSIYQIRPQTHSAIRAIRPLYVLSCALNVGWIYSWHHNQIFLCLILILLLAVTLFLIGSFISSPGNAKDYWFVKAPFGLYFGWVTAATLINFMVWLKSSGHSPAPQWETALALGLIAAATILGIFFRILLRDYIFPVSIAWALTGIAIEQTGNTAIIAASAAGVIASLIAALSFVLAVPNKTNPGNI